MKLYCAKIEYEFLILLFMAVQLFLFIPYFSPTVTTALGITFCFFIAWFLGQAIRHTDNHTKKAVVFFTAFLLASPIFNTTVFADNLIVRRTTINNAVLIVGLFLLFDSFGRSINPWRAPVLCFVVCAVFPASAIFFIPTVITLCLVHYKLSDSSSRFVLLGASCIAACTVGFLLFGGEVLQAASFTPVAAAALNLNNAFFRLLFIFPFAAIFPVLSVKTIKNTKDKNVKIAMILILAGLVKSLLFLVLNNPSLDFIMLTVLEQYCYTLYLSNIKNTEFLVVMQQAGHYLKKNLLLTGLTLIYLAAFSLFNASLIRNWITH